MKYLKKPDKFDIVGKPGPSGTSVQLFLMKKKKNARVGVHFNSILQRVRQKRFPVRFFLNESKEVTARFLTL